MIRLPLIEVFSIPRSLAAGWLISVVRPTVAAGKKSARWPTLQDILFRSQRKFTLNRYIDIIPAKAGIQALK